MDCYKLMEGLITLTSIYRLTLSNIITFQSEFILTFAPSMSSSNTSSSPLSPPPPSLESNKTTMNMYNHSLSFSNSSTSATKIFGDNTHIMRKAMRILEEKFGQPHISSSSSSNNTNINHVVNNTKQMTVNVPIVFYPPNISADPASQSRELPPQTFTFVATASVDVGNGNKNKREEENKKY